MVVCVCNKYSCLVCNIFLITYCTVNGGAFRSFINDMFGAKSNLMSKRLKIHKKPDFSIIYFVKVSICTETLYMKSYVNIFPVLVYTNVCFYMK